VTSRLCIGSAQFGLKYGVSNRVGKVSPDEVTAILSSARTFGIDTIDTAASYGDSEQCLGSIGMEGWRVVTKVPPIPESCQDAANWVLDSIATSLQRLGVSRLYAVLLHGPRQLLESRGPSIYQGLAAAKDRGLCSKVGVSVYGPEDLDALIPAFEIGIVQAPLNVLDRRLLHTGWLDRLARLQIEVHARSVFLQGLLLMNSRDRPARFGPWHDLLEAWERWLVQQSLTPLRACVGFALSHPAISRVVIGMESVEQLAQICSAAHPLKVAPPDELATRDEGLINPSNWIS
jgi:aryl-alcohol dehydrogenase-like predicted oxidoreductase